MGKIIYLGSTDQIEDKLELDSMEQLMSNEKVVVNDKYWLFTTEEELSSLQEIYPNVNIENRDISEWAIYVSTDYRINSMEDIEFDELVNNKEFTTAIVNTVKNITSEELVSFDIYRHTENVLKELIINKLYNHIEKLKSEIKN